MAAAAEMGMKKLRSVSGERVLSADFSAEKLWEVESCKEENIKKANSTTRTIMNSFMTFIFSTGRPRYLGRETAIVGSGDGNGRGLLGRDVC